jgi:hypothetical protein
MERLTFALAWPRFLDTPLRPAKREALVTHVAPVLDALVGEGILDGWTHVFWGGDDLGTKVVRCTAWGEDADAAADRLREHYTDEGFEEDREFRVAVSADSERAERFWGEHLGTWLEASSRLSTLSVAAIEGELGESLRWHVTQNRPGHVWANQLGLTFMDEAAVYQRLALGYLEHAASGTEGEQREAFERVREHMRAALDSLPEPDPDSADTGEN